MTHEEKALSYLSNEYNCAQAVLGAFASEFGIEEELALRLATEFGGGVRCGQLCGAVSGAMMVLGLKHGNCHSGDKNEIIKAYNISVEFNKRFCERNNSIVCKELLGYDFSIPEHRKIIREQNMMMQICPKMVVDAVEIIEQLISDNNSQSISVV